MKKKKVTCSEIEFVNETADDCIKNLSVRDKKLLIEHPYAIDYHFSYCMYIRNHYIHNRDFSEAPFYTEPDNLSSEIITMIFSRLLPDYDYDNPFVISLYDTMKFIKLRKEYKRIYGEYPVFLVEKYKSHVKLEPEHLASEISSDTGTNSDWDIQAWERNRKVISKKIDSLIHELAELVWQTELLKKTAEECDIAYAGISEKTAEFKDLFFTGEVYVPLQVCFLPYRKKIGYKRYVEYRRLLVEQIREEPRIITLLDESIFYDRVLARMVLKDGSVLQYLPMYRDDEQMVTISLKNYGEAIEYAGIRFQEDRKWAKFAIEHSRKDSILARDCMKPYKTDKELVYLACAIEAWNFTYLDEAFRDDFDLAKICLQQLGDHISVYSYLSKRLKDNKELAILDMRGGYPHTEDYSPRLQDDDEIAAKLFELFGTKPWAWEYMSRRLKEKYGIQED